MKNFITSVCAVLCLALTARAAALPQIVPPTPAEIDFTQGGPGIVPFKFGDAPGGITKTPPPVLPSKLTIELWNAKRKCDPDYFKATREIKEQSGATSWYYNWTQKQAKENAAEYAELGEYRTFHKEFFGSFDFHCGIEKNGCNRFFTCEESVRSIRASYPDIGVAEALELARKVYLTHHALVHFAQWVNWAHRTISNVQASSSGFTNNLVTSFSLQPNAVANTMCELLQKGVNTAWNIAVSSAGPLLSWQIGLASAGKDLVSKVGEGIEVKKDAAAKDAAARGDGGLPNVDAEMGGSITSKLFAAVDHIREATEKILDYHNTFFQGSHVGDGTGIPGMGNAAHASGWCQALGGGIADQNAERINALHVFTAENAMATRTGLANLLNVALNGDVHDGKAGTVLNHLMSFQDWGVDHRSAAKDEQTATSAYIEYLMSGIWRNAKCYEKCTTTDLDALCSGRSNAEKLGHRYCKDGRACQLQCWSTQRVGNHEMKFHGHKVIGGPKYNLTMENVGEASFLNYQRAGGNNMNRGEPMQKFLESMVSNTEKRSNLAVPVCSSDNLVMGDLHRWTTFKHPDATRFPCTCGNWRSDETRSFMQSIGMHNDSASYNSAVKMAPGMVRETLTHFCPNNLRKLPPLTNYLAMCELGIQNPHKSSRPGHTYTKQDKGRLHLIHRVHLGTDVRCNDIKAATSAMTEGEANYWFCKNSDAAKSLFADEYVRAHVKQAGMSAGKQTGMVLRLINTHKKRCGTWLRREGWRYELKVGDAVKEAEVLEKEAEVAEKEDGAEEVEVGEEQEQEG